jgi:SAM-dependent methyltransferase
MNINTKAYWDGRFGSGDWEENGGRKQTRSFALGMVKQLELPRTFAGSILDFGCGLGDALPVYRRHFPNAKLIGMDVSDQAVRKCQASYGGIAEFLVGDHTSVPEVDAILASNVLEHLTNDEDIAACLLGRCRDLFIQVPYRQVLVPGGEHVNAYDESAFHSLGVHCYRVFACPGWSEYGWSRWVNLHLRNVHRALVGVPRAPRSKQILYHLVNASRV